MNTEFYDLTVVDLGCHENEKQISVLVSFYEEFIELNAVIDGKDFSAKGDDLFSSFQLFRDKLLESGYGIKCNAARINALQSGMMRDTDVVYLVELGKKPGNEDIHSFWDYCEMNEYPFTEEQEQFRKMWMESV